MIVTIVLPALSGRRAILNAAAKAAPNDPRVAFQLGRAYLAAKDYESGRPHLKFAADQGDAGGQNALGILYATGRGGLAQDAREAVRLYKLAADQGNAIAQAALERLTKWRAIPPQ